MLRRFEIKGDMKQEAVFCTEKITYSMRAVSLSNAVLVVTSPPDDAINQHLAENVVVIRDALSEIIELTPIVPKLHQLDSLLEGLEYDENSVDRDEEVGAEVWTRFSRLFYATQVYSGSFIIT